MVQIIVFLVAAIFVSATSSRNPCLETYDIYTGTGSHFRVDLAAADINTILTNIETAIIVHGHRGSGVTSLNPRVKDAFLARAGASGMNVIVIDWQEYARNSYSIASNSVSDVARCIADKLQPLLSSTPSTDPNVTPTPAVLSYNLIHLVGFDLGAHLVGMIGRSLDQKVGRITGLSPSRQGWNSRSGRLSSGDATYVEVIHTDSNGAFGHGVNEAIGQVDFFVNGGSGQPGCFLNNRCDHDYSWNVFALSILQNIFGNQCRNRHQVTLNTCRNGAVLIMGSTQLSKIGSGYYRVNT